MSSLRSENRGTYTLSRDDSPHRMGSTLCQCIPFPAIPHGSLADGEMRNVVLASVPLLCALGRVHQTVSSLPSSYSQNRLAATHESTNGNARARIASVSNLSKTRKLGT